MAPLTENHHDPGGWAIVLFIAVSPEHSVHPQISVDIAGQVVPHLNASKRHSSSVLSLSSLSMKHLSSPTGPEVFVR